MLVASDLDKKASTKWYMVNIGIIGIPKKFCDGGPDADKGKTGLSSINLIFFKVLAICAKKAIEYMLENDIMDKSEIAEEFQNQF